MALSTGRKAGPNTLHDPAAARDHGAIEKDHRLRGPRSVLKGRFTDAGSDLLRHDWTLAVSERKTRAKETRQSAAVYETGAPP